MSDRDRSNKPPREGAKPRSPQFGVREERPRRPPPDPLSRSRDPFEGVDVGPRMVSRPATAIRERQPIRPPLITTKSVADDEVEQHAAPSARAAADLHRARGFVEPPARAAAYPRGGSAPYHSGSSLGPRGLWIATAVSIICLIVLYTLWLQPARTNLSAFNGGRSAPAADLPPVDPASYPQLAVTPGESSVVGPPTISAADVDAILAQYSSPAVGTGQAWVDLGIQYQIDPAYAVAFFIHESSAGTNPGWAGFKPDGSSTHNVGNIICAGYPTCFNRFRDYPSWEIGIEDWYKLIAVEYINGRGAHTVEQIIPIYAPSFENNVPQYVAAVNDLVNTWRNQGVRR